MSNAQQNSLPAPTLTAVKSPKRRPRIKTKIYRKRREVKKDKTETALFMGVVFSIAAMIFCISIGYWVLQNWTA